MLKLNAIRMQLAIFLLLSITVSILARPQDENSDPSGRSGPSESSGSSGSSGSDGNSGSSSGSGLEIQMTLDQLLNYLELIFGKETVDPIKTYVVPLISGGLSVPADLISDSVSGLVKGTKSITDVLNPLINTIKSIPVVRGIFNTITSVISTPADIIETIVSVISKIFSIISGLLL